MERKVIACLTGISAICLAIACMLRYAGGQEMEYGFQKSQEKGRTKQDTGQGVRQETKQRAARQEEQEWVVKEDVQDSIKGRNLTFHGCYLLEEGDCLFVAGLNLLGAGETLYGGKDVSEKEYYNIYCLKNDAWEVFVSHPPESVNSIEEHFWKDETYINSLVYDDGFLYYSLVYDDEPGMGGDKQQFIYRIPLQGGEAEELARYYETFYIYNRKIYYIGLESKAGGKREYVYWEMEPDGTDRRAVYRRKAELRHRSFTVGGGCLYVEEADGNGITGVNLETGDIKYYKTSWENMEELCYENGYLYFLADYGGLSSIYRMDVISGEKEKLADDVDEAWLADGYLYYTWYDSAAKKWNLSVLQLETMQASAEVLEEPGTSSSILQTVEDDLLVTIIVYDEYLNVVKRVYYRYRANTLFLERLDRKEVLAENP